MPAYKLFLIEWTRRFFHCPGSSDNQRNKHVLYITYYDEGREHGLFFIGLWGAWCAEAQAKNT